MNWPRLSPTSTPTSNLDGIIVRFTASRFALRLPWLDTHRYRAYKNAGTTMSRLVFLFTWIALGLALLPLRLQAASDTVTLTSGEIVIGRVVSETDSNVDVEISNEHHTVFTTRTISKSDIKEMHQLTPAQRQEDEAYEALGRYQFNPNQEFTSAQYAQVIAAYDKFLATYPNSEYATKVAGQRTEWRFEKFEVENGRVKFDGKWMTPEQKKPLAEEVQRQQTEKFQAQQRKQLEQALQAQVQVVRAAKARLAAAQKEHDFLHSTAGYKGKMLEQPEYDRVMLRYHANDEELSKAPSALNDAMAKFNEWNTTYHKAGGTINFQEQIDGK
jgi:hypothetical protein